MRTPMMLYGTPLVAFPPSFFAERYDVIHANFPSPYLAAISAFASTLRNNPSVLTWHNDLPAVTSSAGLLIRLHDTFSHAYLSAYRSIIATTPTYAKTSTTLRRFSNKVRIIPNGVDTKKFHPGISGASIREKYNLGNSVVVLFVGALTKWHAYKGVDVLLRAFSTAIKSCDDLKLLIVGEGTLRHDYVKLAMDLGISENVVFTGSVPDDQLPMYYAACDIFVLPSKDSSEGFGLVLLEAMACGKAVIGSAVGGIPDVIDNGKNGILASPSDVEQLSDAICVLFSDSSLRNSLGFAGQVFASTRDWAIVAESTLLLYEELQ